MGTQLIVVLHLSWLWQAALLSHVYDTGC